MCFPGRFWRAEAGGCGQTGLQAAIKAASGTDVTTKGAQLDPVWWLWSPP